MHTVSYSFSSRDFAASTFSVVDFKGYEALSRPYEYTIRLKSKEIDLDIDALFKSPCCFTLSQEDFETPIHGVVCDVEQLNRIGDYVFYQVVLVPRLWRLSQYSVNEVYLEMSVPDMISTILEETGLSSADYQLDLSGTYKTWPYRCQFGESHLDMISRLMEHEGMVYFFEQGADAEKLIISDQGQAYSSIEEPAIRFSQISGLDATPLSSHVQSFVCRRKPLPRKVTLKDYNYEKPSLDITGEAAVDDNGMGEVFTYGEHVSSSDEGEQLAKVRAEELLCQKEQYTGESTVCRFQPGSLFELSEHFREAFNQEYLIVSLEHQGAAPGHLTENEVEEAGVPGYQNSFTAIPSGTPYRPPRATPKPRFYGTITAFIDGGQSGQYAEVDDHGRYKVVLPFDRVQKEEGKASHWIRMASPFGGEREGMHFPLRKGTEVLLTFLNGDPDQPIISGAVPNTAQPSLVVAKNQSAGVIKTSSGNLFEMEDKEGSSRIKLASPKNQTYLHLGAANAPGDGLVALTQGIHRMEVSGGQQLTIAATNADGTPSVSYMESAASEAEQVYGTDTSKDLINDLALFQFKKLSAAGTGSEDMSTADELSGKYLIERRKGDKYLWTDGNEYIFGGGNVFEFGNAYEEKHATSGKSVGTESFDIPRITGTNIDESFAKGRFRPNDHFVEKSWGDTFTYQEGNNYSWGDTYDFEFGNGYTETHVTGTAILQSHLYDNYQWIPVVEAFGAVAINPDTAIVEKTYGDTYSFQTGNNREVHFGNVSETVTGIHWEYHLGDLSVAHFAGVQIEVNEAIMIANILGFEFEFDEALFKFEFTLAITMEILLGMSIEIHKAYEVEMNDAGKLVVAGSEIETKVNELSTKATAVESNTNELSTKANNIESKVNDVDTATNELKTRANEIKTAANDIGNKMMKLESNQLAISAGAVHLIN